jgi:hypothetical protein
MERVQMMQRLLAEIRANNEDAEVLRDILVSRMDAHQAKTDANHKEFIAAMKASHGKNGSPDGHQSTDNAGLPRKD